MVNQRRELEIKGTFVDGMSRPLGNVRQNLARLQKGFGTFGKNITAPLRVPLKLIDSLARKLLNVQNLIGGFIAVQALRSSFRAFTGIADELDEIVKTSDRLQATTESLSALKFVGELSAIQFSEISAALAIFSRNLEAARRGSVLQAQAFRDLNLDVDALADLDRIDLVDLLADVSDGFNSIGSATERNNALLTVFGRSGSRLGPLLAGGSSAIREMADEAERLGVVFGPEQLGRAAAFNDALTRLQTSIRGVAEATFIELAPGISAVFEDLAKRISGNREEFVELFKSIGRGFLQFIDVVSRGIIELIGLLESVPGIDLNLDPAKVAEVERLQRAIEALSVAPGANNSFKIAFLRDELDKLNAQLAEEAAGPGLAERLRAQRADFVRTLESAFGQSVDEAKPGVNAQFQRLLREAGIVTNEDVIAAVKNGVIPPEALIEGVEQGLFDPAVIARINEIVTGVAAEAVGATRQQSDADIRAALNARQQNLAVRQQLAGLKQDTVEVRLEMVELNAEASRLRLRQAFQNGAISAEQLAAGLELVNEQAALAARRIRGDFALGFQEGAEQALESLTNLTNFGNQAAQQLVGQGINGLTDALFDIATQAKSAKDAFRDFALETLKLVLRLIIQFSVLRSVRGAAGFAFAEGGIMPGQMGLRSSAPKPLPIQEYAQGGIANTPQMAVFGEGRGAEAFVPLPDGRTIPVTMTGGGGGGMTLIVQSIDSRDTARFFIENRELLWSLQNEGVDSRLSSRAAVRRAA